MGKQITTISIDVNILALAKAKRMNISGFVEESLKHILSIKDDDLIEIKKIEELEAEKIRKSAELSLISEKINIKKEEMKEQQDEKVNKEKKRLESERELNKLFAQ